MVYTGIGTELKINVHIEPFGDLHMSDYDFSAKFYTRAIKPFVVHKRDMIQVDNDNYIARVETGYMTPSVLTMVVTAQIPDADFPDGLRTEVTAPINLYISLVK